jgi:HAD superfamily hydrolase (TIGR01549 family)
LTLHNKTLFIFDLDNTLYDEYKFLEGKMKIFLANQYVDGSLTDLILFEFNKCFINAKLENIIQHLNSIFNVDLSVEVYKQILRSKEHEVEICYYPGVKEKISSIINLGYKVRLLTNGNLDQQKQKIESLSKVLDLSDRVVYATEIASKPDPEGLYQIIKQEKVNKSDAILIGDSKVDFDCAVNAQIDFISAKTFFDLSN